MKSPPLLLSSSSSSSFILRKYCRISPYYIIFIFLAFFVFVAVVLFSDDFSCSLSRHYIRPRERLLPAFAIGTGEEECDVFSGRWVKDDEEFSTRRPLYEQSECPYIQPQLTCQEHGRPDKEYQRWRWQPNRCSLPRKGSFEDEKQDIVELSTEDAYRTAIRSMLKWVQRSMDLKRTRVFFTTMSPTHAKSIDWGGIPDGNCYNETEMIKDPTYWGSDSRKSIMRVISDEFRKSKVPISLLNITQLSSYRKEAHTSIYKKQWNPLTPEQLANPASYADCVHWCLPGLQDTWNELLFAKLFYP